MKNILEKKNRVIIITVICIAFLSILIGVSMLLENMLDIREKTKVNDTIYEKHVAMISGEPTEEFWLSIYNSAREEGKKQGIYIENFGERLVKEYTTEELVEMAIAARVDGIILKADGGDDLAEEIRKAAKEKIPVMTILTDVPNSERISFVSGSDYATGEMYGNLIIEEVQKKREQEDRQIRVTVLVDSDSENATPNLIYSGIHEKIASLGEKIMLSAKIIDNSGKFESEETVRDLILDQEPPDIIVCLSAVDTISTYQSIIDYNRVGQISIIGYYSSEDTLEGIQKGIIQSSVLINAQDLGETAADGMSEYLEEEYVSEYLTVTPTLIEKSNVENYMKKDE